MIELLSEQHSSADPAYQIQEDLLL